MTTTPTITNQEEEYAALDRLEAVRYRTDFTDEELVEYRALSKALSDYQHEAYTSKLPDGDPAIHFEVRLDMEMNTLDELMPLFGGMDEFIAFMTREKPLSEQMMDKLIAELRIGRDCVDGPWVEPGGWEWIEEFDDGEGWRAEMLAHRDAKAGTNTDIQDRQDNATPRKTRREPELAVTA